MFIVFDLDGTLANIDHRLHHIEGEKKDWRAFFADCVDDEPISYMLENLKAFEKAGHRVEVWTGRSDEVREETERWLRAVYVDVPVVMRKEGDHSPDDQVKGEWLQQRGKPDLVIEDRARVVHMWRKLGVNCLQIAEGEF